jgi:perosamine synthetase
MSIFNSLGSNYDLNFALKALFSMGKSNLKEKLEQKYGGKAVLFYKGREAITFGLKSLSLPQDSLVAINGFTCYAVYRAIEEAGLKPLLIDVPDKGLNFDLKELEEKCNSKVKAVIIQNTLGYPCDIEAISKFCKDKGIALIEDLAHSAGTVYSGGREAGTVGDITILSFSQDKIIDGVSGGALISRNSKSEIRNPKLGNPSILRQLKDRLYPLLTLKIRFDYSLGIGKPVHLLLKKMRLLSTPMDGSLYGLLDLPDFHQTLAQKALDELNENLKHRRKIAKIYGENLNQDLVMNKVVEDINSSSNLRFPILIPERKRLLNYLKNKGFHLSDIWYDAPIAPKRFMGNIDYSGQCPNAEEISEKILNLPTHKNISEKQALHLSKLINQFLE